MVVCHQPLLPSVSHLRMDGSAREVAARCINFCFVFGGVAQHVTLSVTARPLIWLPDVVTRQVRSLHLIQGMSTVWSVAQQYMRSGRAVGVVMPFH